MACSFFKSADLKRLALFLSQQKLSFFVLYDQKKRKAFRWKDGSCV